MADIGIVTTHRTIWPDADELDGLGLLPGGWVRSIVYDLVEFEEALRKLPAVNVIAMVNNECAQVGRDWSGWDAAMERVASWRNTTVRILVAGNELDLWLHLGDKQLTPSFAADLARRAAAKLKGSGILTSACGVAGPDWQGYLEAMNRAGLGGVDLACFHGYGQALPCYRPEPTFGEIGASLEQARRLAGGRPVLVDEMGAKLRDIFPAGNVRQREAAQAEYVKCWVETFAAFPETLVPVACYFALGDIVGTPEEQDAEAFGLRRLDHSERPAYAAFREAVRRAEQPPQPIPVPNPIPVPPQPEAPHVGPGVAAILAREGWVALGPEEYPSPTYSQTLVSTSNGGGVRWLFWSNSTQSCWLGAPLAEFKP